MNLPYGMKIAKAETTKKGLTLIELLISVMLISAMLGAVWVIYSTGFKVFYGQVSRYDIKDETGRAFITMTKELYQAISVTAATATLIRFTADLNSDGLDEEITYTWSGVAGEPLKRTVGAQTTKLVRSVNNPPPLSTNPLFTYFGADNAVLGTTPTVSQVQLVAVDLYTTSDPETFHLRTKIFLQTIQAI